MRKESKKEWKKKYIYICLTELLCYTPKTNRNLKINSTPIKLKLKSTPCTSLYQLSKKMW